MPDFLSKVIPGVLLVLLYACSSEPDTGPQEVKWDRDACERCRMVLSDRRFAAQVRYFPPGKRSRVSRFDDIGCALLWLEQSTWKNDPRTQVWVTNHRNGDWINARTATYLQGKISPMEFGLGAQPDPDPEGLAFEQAKLHIDQVEERFDIHGVHLLERLKKQAEKREAASRMGISK